jgi:hypothetical protein
MNPDSELDSETIIALEAKLNAALNRTDPSREEVRNIVCALVDKMKSAGVS